MDALTAFRNVDFDWTMHLDAVWNAAPYDVDTVHGSIRREFDHRVSRLVQRESPLSPLGLVLAGRAGVGKTHLLGALRRQAQAADATFVLADLTDVHDFWETLALGWLRSLQRPGPTGAPQFRELLSYLVRAYPPNGATGMTIGDLSTLRPPKLINVTNALLQAVGKAHRAEEHAHQDVVRALVLMANDNHDLWNLGYGWLEAIAMEEEERLKHGFRDRVRRPREVVEGLSWLCGLRGPTVLALDQLDAIVSEHNIAAGLEAEEFRLRQQAALAIIEGIGGGLMALRDVLKRTLIVVSCLADTWEVLRGRALASVTDRYEQPIFVQPPDDAEAARHLVELRLRAGYDAAGFTPPEPTWPFAREAFASAAGLSPRDILKRCEEHRRRCLQEGEVTGLRSFVAEPAAPTSRRPPTFEALDARYAALQRSADLAAIFRDDHEEDADALLEAAARFLVEENEPDGDVDATVETEFAGTAGHDPLHARIRLTYLSESQREHHASLRYLTHGHHLAFQARLKSAMTASGIDRKLPFRALFVFRPTAVPKGAKTQALCEQFIARGGRFLEPSEHDVRAMAAFRALWAERPVELEAWIRARRPASRLAVLEPIAGWLQRRRKTSMPPAAGPGAEREPPVPPGAPLPSETAPSPTVVKDPGMMPLGKRLLAGQARDAVTAPLGSLAKHTVVLAGAGSGKTVFVRRLVEEAALRGIPSIVIDVANDLSTLGDAWPEAPATWRDDDAALAGAYRTRAEVVIWTPGVNAGNPLTLEPLPDFAALGGDADELEQAVQLAAATLRPIAIPGGGAKSRPAQGILKEAIGFFARQGGGTLPELVALLSDLPADLVPGYANATKTAKGMADQLRAEMALNPVLKPGGTPLDPALLLRSKAPGKTRVSVVNLAGLANLEAQQQFVNQLAMTLFSWIKRHPAKDGAVLTGLMVIDEARDFVPSGKAVASTDSLKRLAAQGRKYGLGMVFATQAPKSIDHNVIANCQTQVYGRASSPAAIDVIVDQIKLRGAAAQTSPR